eukprot:TRINITY_DN1000_c0_g1_i1.p1 TRINITY_DN1000_c0_g1~~TRINITY_DN1000_c0_g1_i1.p1  ORF type:complete len:641 (+),score=139.19 TRINITY_DN1000_c0_g1_i1:1-1923(+)
MSSRHPIINRIRDEDDLDDYDDYGTSFSPSPSPNSSYYLYQEQYSDSNFSNWMPPASPHETYEDDEESYAPIEGGKDDDSLFDFEEGGTPTERKANQQKSPVVPKPEPKPTKGDITPFQFDTPSPDDLVKDKQKQAFSKQKEKAEPKTKPTASSGQASPLIERSQIPSIINLTQDLSLHSSPATAKKTIPKQMAPSKRKETLEKIAVQKTSGKESLNLVVIGHVDAGKSTLMGHLLYLLGQVDPKIMHKYEKESKQIGKQSFSYAWVLDEYDEERQRGITMDVGMNHFETEKKRLTLLDAPGHRDFVPNMITGTAQADVAILVISAATGEFESGFQADGQTKEHSLLAKALGVAQLIIVINKLDMVNWSEERFESIKEKMNAFLRQTGFVGAQDLFFVPCSGLSGENLVTRKDPTLSSWYTGSTLVQQIDLFKPAQRFVDKPFRVCVSDVYKSQASGLTIAGKIESGFVTTGDNLMVVPLNEVCVVKGLRVNEESVPFASAGDNVDISVANVDISALSIGQFLCDPEAPIKTATRFVATIITFSTLAYPLTLGAQVDLHYQTINEPAVISKLISLVDKSRGKGAKRNNPRCITESSQAEVEVTVIKPVCLELYSDMKQLGRFSLRESGRTVAAGVVTQLF